MIKASRVLVVDDDSRVLRFLRANIESVGYEVVLAEDAVSSLELMEKEEPDLVIVDIMLPGMDGFELCRRIREFSIKPIMMLTAKVEEADKVKRLRIGADDYLTKPFSAQELIARVEALLRRSKLSESEQHHATFTQGDLFVDFSQRKVNLRGKEVVLTPTEYKLLYQLATNAGKVMFHEDLLTRVWGTGYHDELEYLRAYIRNLRRKIEDDPHRPKYILSRPGVGYMFAATRESK